MGGGFQLFDFGRWVLDSPGFKFKSTQVIEFDEVNCVITVMLVLGVRDPSARIRGCE